MQIRLSLLLYQPIHQVPFCLKGRTAWISISPAGPPRLRNGVLEAVSAWRDSQWLKISLDLFLYPLLQQHCTHASSSAIAVVVTSQSQTYTCRVSWNICQRLVLSHGITVMVEPGPAGDDGTAGISLRVRPCHCPAGLRGELPALGELCRQRHGRTFRARLGQSLGQWGAQRDRFSLIRIDCLNSFSSLEVLFFLLYKGKFSIY